MSSKKGDKEAAMSHDVEKADGDGSNSSKTSDTSDSEEEPTTNDAILTLRDPTYLGVLHQYFKKLGPKTSPNDPDFTEAMASKEVFDMFKNKGGKFLKLKNGRSFEGGYIEVDDDEAMEKIHHDIKRRMESAKRWLESKKSKSPVKKEKSPPKKKSSPPKKKPSPAKKSPLTTTIPKPAASSRKQSNSAIILSLTDPIYKEMMHKYFKRMGPKSNKNQISDADEAVEMLKEFKSMSSGKFMKIENWRDPDSDYVEVDDDEAVKRIKIDLTRRNDSMKQWLDPKPKSLASKSGKSPPNKSPPKRDTVEEEDSDDESDSPEPTTRTLRKKEIPNYANSGAGIVSKLAEQVEAERTAKQSLSSEDKASSKDRRSPSKDVPKSKQLGTYTYDNSDRVFYDLSSRVTKYRENDTILSLRDAKYRDVLVACFNRLGTEQDTDKNHEAAEEVFEIFKQEGGRFFKPTGRGKDADCDQVEDSQALQNMYQDIRRRVESLWWLDEKEDVSPSKKKSSKSPPKRDTVEEEDSDDESDSPEPTTRTLRKKEIPNYANSGARIVSKLAKQVEAERTAKQSLSSEDKASSKDRRSPSKDVPKSKQLGTYTYDNSDRVFYDLSSRVTKYRENDTILSLRDAKYRDVLVACFNRLGTEQDTDKNHEAAEEVFEIFKQEGGRFFKPTGRGKDADCDQVEDSQALQNLYQDIRRRVESLWWLDEKEDVSPSKKKSSSGTTKAKKKAKPTRHIIVSLSDPNYREIMEVEFKKLGEKTGADKREVAAAEEVFGRFKREGAKFCRLENFRDSKSDPIEMDEVEAFKKIRTDMQRRMESAKRWLDGGVNSKSYAVSNTGSPKQSPPAPKTTKKSNAGNAKKRELPVQSHRSSPPKKKMKVDASRPRSEVPSRSEGTRRSSRVAAEPLKRGSERQASSMDTDVASTSLNRRAPRNRSQQLPGNVDKITICFDDHAIDTEVNQSSIPFSQDISLPGRFDPNVRPPVPAHNKQIYIPGSEVYARWLNENDPSSYGTWYPGYVYSSKLAPTNVPGGDMPKLLYHVRFHDGAEGMDLHTNDMMMREQYEAWLRDLEEYYALPQLGSAFTTNIPKGARVYAQWIDPTDPQAHGSWLQGTVRDVKGSSRYHVRFDNGDEDDDMSANHVLLDGVYVQLLGEKMKNDNVPAVSRELSVVNGINRTNGHLQQRLVDNCSRATVPIATQRVQIPSTLKFTCEIATEDFDLSSNDGILEELHCDEFLDTVKPFRSKTQEIHYGIYVKAKPWYKSPQLEVTVPMEIDKSAGNETESKDVSMEDLRCEETLV